ncbi:M28 family peptidase [Adhaeribacter terreus]|uniref:M28 family peptidase n=1 Tax=Adhaeribacter terreus TaxID=529703 RepID=A0ABW0E7X3_9BACT
MKLFATVFLLFLSFDLYAGKSDTTQIRSHLITLTKTPGFRNYQDLKTLNEASQYIETTFRKYSERVVVQPYNIGKKTYQNIICSFGPENAPRIIVGAHYDVCDNQQGADDNASGTTGLLELARLLQHENLNVRIDLVAYTLEEPPYFRTQNMGSYVHAKSLAEAKVPVLGMVSLEMIGYFKDEKHTQDYPVGALKLVYGNRGNYITLVRKFGAGKFARQFNRTFHKTDLIRTKSFVGPAALPGIDFSDHLNYWAFGFSALMVTDTAFYRNKNYHQPTDTLKTLDLTRMANVIDSVYETLLKLAKN